LSAATLGVVAAAVAIAALVQGTTGVGFALIVAPVLAFLAPELLPACVLMLMIPLNIYVAWRERSALDRHGAGWITAGRFAGTFGGVWILSVLALGELSVVTGAATVLAALATLLAPRFTPGRKAFVAAGAITGVMETATGIGGPPLALVYQHHTGPTLRATLAFCFLVGQLISLALLAGVGRVNASQLRVALALVPAVVVGAALSRLAHRRLDGRLLRGIVLAFATISGLVLILRG
jgi:uncharacterized membrane protein YfcA